jgi:hypothetical protein
MSYRFKIVGRGFQHSLEKECDLQSAVVHASQVAKEYARDAAFQGATILVADEVGQQISIVPVATHSADERTLSKALGDREERWSYFKACDLFV